SEQPSIALTPGSMSFTANLGRAAPPSLTLAVTTPGSGSFSYPASTDAVWLSASPTSGSTNGSVAGAVDPAGLATGTYSGHVIVTAGGIANSPQSIPVTLTVLSQDMTETFADLGSGWTVSPMGNAGGWSAANGVYTYSGI